MSNNPMKPRRPATERLVASGINAKALADAVGLMSTRAELLLIAPQDHNEIMNELSEDAQRRLSTIYTLFSGDEEYIPKKYDADKWLHMTLRIVLGYCTILPSVVAKYARVNEAQVIDISEERFDTTTVEERYRLANVVARFHFAFTANGQQIPPETYMPQSMLGELVEIERINRELGNIK